MARSGYESGGRSRGGPLTDAGLEEQVGRAVAQLVLVLGGLAGLVLAAGHLSARLTDGAWPAYPMGEIPNILGRLFTDPVAPAGAWEPANDGGQPADGWGYWLTFLVLLVAAGRVGMFVQIRMRDRAARKQGDGGGGRWRFRRPRN